jgi:hypothetical protein
LAPRTLPRSCEAGWAPEGSPTSARRLQAKFSDGGTAHVYDLRVDRVCVTLVTLFGERGQVVLMMRKYSELQDQAKKYAKQKRESMSSGTMLIAD